MVSPSAAAHFKGSVTNPPNLCNDLVQRRRIEPDSCRERPSTGFVSPHRAQTRHSVRWAHPRAAPCGGAQTSRRSLPQHPGIQRTLVRQGAQVKIILHPAVRHAEADHRFQLLGHDGRADRRASAAAADRPAASGRRPPPAPALPHHRNPRRAAPCSAHSRVSQQPHAQAAIAGVFADFFNGDRRRVVRHAVVHGNTANFTYRGRQCLGVRRSKNQESQRRAWADAARRTTGRTAMRLSASKHRAPVPATGDKESARSQSVRIRLKSSPRALARFNSRA